LVSSAEQIDEALTVVWNWLGRKAGRAIFIL
jgi:hypothetical protein